MDQPTVRKWQMPRLRDLIEGDQFWCAKSVLHPARAQCRDNRKHRVKWKCCHQFQMCPPFASANGTCWKKKAVPKAGGPNSAGTMNQNRGCFNACTRVQWRCPIPFDVSLSAMDCGVRSVFSNENNTGAAKMAIRAATPQRSRHSINANKTTNATGKLASPKAYPILQWTARAHAAPKTNGTWQRQTDVLPSPDQRSANKRSPISTMSQRYLTS